jgi:hypothetical protein
MPKAQLPYKQQLQRVQHASGSRSRARVLQVSPTTQETL